MARTSFKCCVCGKMTPSELRITVNKKNFCQICGQEALKEAKAYKDLIAYIWDNLGVRDLDKDDFNMALLTTNIKTLKEKYGIGYAQARFTLIYMYEYEDDEKKRPGPFEKETDIFNVIRFFKDSKEFWSSFKRLQAVSAEKIERALTLPQNKIVVTRSMLNAQQDEYKKRLQQYKHQEEIDLSNIEEELRKEEMEGGEEEPFAPDTNLPSSPLFEEQDDSQNDFKKADVMDILMTFKEEGGQLDAEE